MSDLPQVAPRTAQRVDEEVRFFDAFVGSHGDYDVLGDGAYRRLLDVFERTVAPQPGEHCIDLGCGTGAFTRRLRHLNLRLEGMDITPRAIDLANERAAGERYILGDITHSGLPASDYHIVLLSGVLHHFPSPEDRHRVLTEAFRLLAPGGRLFAFDPNQHSPSMFLYRDPRSPLHSTKGKSDNEVLLSRAQLHRELVAAGFSNVHVRGVSGIDFRYVESSTARVMLPLYNLYERVIRCSPFERAIGTFVVSVARKDLQGAWRR